MPAKRKRRTTPISVRFDDEDIEKIILLAGYLSSHTPGNKIYTRSDVVRTCIRLEATRYEKKP